MATQSPFTPTSQAYQDAAKALGQSAQAAAVTGTFDESKGAAGRVASITSAGGPLMTAARTRAKQASAKMGLQNSSLAGQAGEQAVIETATPLAQTDAQLYQQQQLANQSAQNQANLANANIRAQTGMAGLQLGENARQFDTGLTWDKEKFGTNLLEQRRQFDTSNTLNKDRLELDRDRFVSDDRYRGLELSQQDRQFTENLRIKQNELETQREQFAQRLGLDKESLQINRDRLSQEDRQFLDGLALKEKELGQQQSQFDARLGLDTRQLDQQQSQFAENLKLERDNLAAQREQFAQRLGLDKEQLQLNKDQLSQQDRQFLAELDQRDAQLAQQESQFVRDQQNRVVLANLDAANREKLMGIEAKYKQDIAGNENISRAWGTMMDSINQIQNNPELDAAAKQTLISNVQAGFQSFSNFWKKATGGTVDVSDLLAFGPGQGSWTPPPSGSGAVGNTGPVNPNTPAPGTVNDDGSYWGDDGELYNPNGSRRFRPS